MVKQRKMDGEKLGRGKGRKRNVV